ncbi:unnamed protein product [Cuscuta campestris]|uniref:Reverse transcriptase Ty1/copia-type domain-containing protein n=1 Tax=Cuscuta campestris TaxID=132261 RepID=A0A484LLS9_9ASTE|nr:unnamed protein product [Cuscuta campestris]
MHRDFKLKELGPLHYFLGIEVQRTQDSILLHQSKYARDLLRRAGMSDCHPAITPMATRPITKPSLPFKDISHFRSIVGEQLADILTKPLPPVPFEYLCSKLPLVSVDQLAGGY